LPPESGLDRGFDVWDTALIGDATAITSDPVTDAAIAWVEDEEPQPFLMFLFYMDPHYAYMEQPGKMLPEPGALVQPGQDIWELRDRLPHLKDDDLNTLRALYAGEVRAFDRAVGRLVRWLKETDRYENTFFLITSDHGEQLGEREWIGHTRNLHAELLDVPLIIAGRKWLEPELRNDPAALIDIYPTVLQLLGLAPMPLPGRGLFSPDRPDRALYSEVTFDPQVIPNQSDPARNVLRARELTKIADQRAVQQGRWKLIRNRLTDTWQLFDRETDPGETQDLSGAHPAVVDALQGSFPEPGSFEVPEEETVRGISEDEITRLRNLGYVN
ncbi:MAG: sulfatase-like hydrolase/transferase, partial [Gemmatimonadetes bacterium]|nr:sulfatase-like hydrolase/transferase [Gemmatimonadota bacterium]